MFNEQNPSGHVVDSYTNHKVVAIGMSIAIVTAVKRFWLGLALGRQTYNQFSDRLAALMGKILLLSEVAALAKDIQREAKSSGGRGKTADVPCILNDKKLNRLITRDDDESSATGSRATAVIDNDDRHPLSGTLNSTQKSRISDLLGEWEEPKIANQTVVRCMRYANI